VKRRAKHVPHGRLYVTDGRTHIGFVELVDGRWRCVSADGELIGIFSTQKEATRALPLPEVTS
jgi:hypothetical protein